MVVADAEGVDGPGQAVLGDLPDVVVVQVEPEQPTNSNTNTNTFAKTNTNVKSNLLKLLKKSSGSSIIWLSPRNKVVNVFLKLRK